MKTQRHLIILLLTFLSLGLANDLAAQRAEGYTYEKTGSDEVTLHFRTSSGTKFNVKVNSGSWSATDYDYIENITVSGGTLNLSFETTGTIFLHGQIKVDPKGTLNMVSTKDNTDTHSTLKRHPSNPDNALILLENTGSGPTACKLKITGKDKNNPFVIDGYGSFTIDGTDASGYTASLKTSDGQVTSSKPLIDVKGSKITLTDVVLRRNYSSSAGCIQLAKSGSYGCDVSLTRCTISYCRGYSAAAAIYLGATESSSLTMTDCEVSNCFSASTNGIIRSANSSVFSKFQMDDCYIRNNYSQGNVSAICWNTYSCTMVMNDCEVTNNYTNGQGGGVVIMGSATLTGCTISGNRAAGTGTGGGGIYYMTYVATNGASSASNSVITLNNTTIENNTALNDGNGGGLYMKIDKIPTTTSGSYHTGIEVTLNVNGGRIGGTGSSTRNTAQHGGGIYVIRESGCDYVTTLNINADDTYGDALIQYNTASSGSVGGGGGIALGGGIVLNLNGTDTHAVKIQNNTAKEYGGGIAVNGTVNVDKYVIVKDNTKVAGATDNVFIRSTATQKFVGIGTNGLSCGSKIGITKEFGFTGTTPSDYTKIAEGTASNCIDAFNNHYFFDDTDTHGVYTSSNSPYSTTSLYFLGSGLSNSWLSNADVSGCTVTDGYVTSVNSAAGLAYLAKDVASGKNYAGKAVSLTADINLSGHNWEPFGSGSCSSCSFSGTFDSQGHTITGLTLGAFPYENVGLFGHVTGTVKNVVINGSVTGSGATNLGGIAGNLDGGTIYNCMVQGTPTGGTNLGALVGNITSGTVENCFAISDAPLCGSGTVTNCYVRLASGGDEDNMGTATNVGASGSTSGAFTETVTPYLYRHDDNKVGSAALLTLLNQWVDAQSTPTDLAHWTRTCASPINGDYPLLKFDGMKCVGTKSGSNDVLTYCNSLNTMLTTHNASGDNIFFWGSESGVSNGNSDANVYFDEDAALIHTSTIANAYVGVWLDNTAGDGGAQPSQGGTDAIDWHLFSSALDNLPIGFTYNTSSYTPGYGHTPPAVTFDDPKTGYFPTNLASYYSEWDFYSYAEPDYHWVNMKRASDDHWHSDYDHWPIHYDNEAHFVSGRGYLVATAEDCFLQGYGTLKKGDVTHPLSYTAGIAYTKRQGFNVLGNPYQSYLDFDRFAHTNSDIWKGGVTESGYIVMDEDQGGYVCYAHGASENHYGANRYIHPHQGFIVMACETAPTTVTFNENMRSVDGTASFRDQRLNYPLVNLIVTEASGNRDLCTVELGRPDKGGLVKAKGVKAGKGSVYCHFEDEDWAIVFTHPGLSEIGIRFETPEDDTFTLTWDTENGDFHYLHLIDNLTGSDIDCLTTDEYRFTAKADDYNSRFRLVFGYTGIEEPESPEPVEGPTTFAFMMGGQLVVNGEGILRLFDVTGRMMTEETVSGTQTVRSLPDTAGIYVLQLVGSNETKTQKIVKQ